MATRQRLPQPRVRHVVRPHQPHAHLYHVSLHLSDPQAQQVLQLPVWIAGSYLVREFAKQVLPLSARQAGRACQVRQTDKATWVVDCAAHLPLEVSYQVHARDESVRTAWLDAQRGFFNGTSLLMRVPECAHMPQQLEIVPPAHARDWQVATGLTPVQTNGQGFGVYQAADYDELVDCPVEMGRFWSGEFVARGVTHRFVVSGAAPSMDGARLLRDTQRICETAIRFWHGNGKPPHRNYVFMLRAVSDGYGGLEHRNSTALICKRSDLPRLHDASSPEGYITLLGLISHEYFHTWNVKRLRPAEFAPCDYSRENHTELLWFFEGFTSYYDDLLLRRAGLISNTQYLGLLNKTIHQVLQTPGRRVHSLAQASFEAWTKYYRPDENTPNLTVSYYTKGALVALCLDLKLRLSGLTLDGVMRALWKHCAGGPMREADLLKVLHTLSGRSWAREIKAWVHGTAELPLVELLQAHGVEVRQEAPPLAQRLGLRVSESQGVQIKQVFNHSPAEHAGFAPGDEWLAIELPARGRTPASTWRLRKLDELPLLAGATHTLTAWVARDQHILRLSLKWDGPREAHLRLLIGTAAKVSAWLDGA